MKSLKKVIRREVLLASILIPIVFWPTFFVPSFEVTSTGFDADSGNEGSDVDENNFLESGGVQDLWVSSIELERRAQDEDGFYDPSWGPYYEGSDYWFDLSEGNPSSDSPGEVFIVSGTKYVSAGSSIQDAIDLALPGDTIDVSPGVYNETVAVHKCNLTLLGADAESTVIDGGGWGDVVKITNSSVRLQNFSIRNGDVGVKIESIYAFNNTVSDNRIYASKTGVYLLNTLNNTITRNRIVSNSESGIAVDGGGGNLVYDNYFSNKVNAYDTNGGETWNRTYGGEGNEIIRSVIQTGDGGYALAGHTTSYGSGNLFWLVKTDSSGNHVWNRTFGGPGSQYANSVVQTGDGGYALAGHTSLGGSQFWLVKTDSTGNHVWNRTFGGSGTETAHSVVQTSDGGYALAGYTDSYGSGYQFMLVKTDSSGNHQWNRTFGGPDTEFAYSVVQTGDGGYALAGVTASYGSGNQFMLVKTDSSGNHQWNKTFGGPDTECAWSMVQTSDGGYALAGWSGTLFCMVKTDASGNKEWNQTYGGLYADIARSIVQTSDGGYALAGYTNSYGSGYQFMLVKTDSSGNHQWNKTFGGPDTEFAYSVVQTSDGGYALAGYTDSYGSGWQLLLVKTYPPAGAEYEANSWNTTKTLGPNIVGGLYVGGNCWSDYMGADVDGDWIADTLLPYNSSGFIQTGGDNLPLTRVLNQDEGRRYASIQAAIDAPETVDGHTILAPAGIYNETVTINKQLTINGSNPTAAGIADSLMAYWSFDESSGTAVRDISGNNNYGIVYGASWTDGKFGKALSFDGVDDYVEVPSSASLNITDGITIAGWFYLAGDPDTTGDNDYRFMVDKMWYYHIILEQSRVISVSVFNSTGQRYWLWTTDALPVGEWHHIAFTYESPNGEMKLYIDGSFYDGKTFIPDKIATNNQPLRISYPPSSPPRTWNGTIDEIMIYSRALSEQEIQAVASSGPIHTQAPIGALYLNESAFTITTSNVTINGFDIRTNSHAKIGKNTGITLASGAQNSTITGNILKCFIGVEAELTSGNNIVTQNRFESNQYGIYLKETSDTTITANTFESNTIAIQLYKSSNNTITGNTISDNNIGILLDESGENTIYNNVFSNPLANAIEKPSAESTTYGGSGNDYACSVVQTSDGGYALTGYSGGDFWLVKTDANGIEEWNKTYGGPGSSQANSIVQTSDGGYALAGYTEQYELTDFWLVKTDSNGNHLWNRTFDLSNDDVACSVVQTSDGGYALAGFTYLGVDHDFWLVKTDSNGNEEWNRTFDGLGLSDVAYSVVQTGDGGYALAGTKVDLYEIADFWLVKTDASGNHLWNSTFRRSSYDEAYSVVQTGDGGYALAGKTYLGFDRRDDFWLVKTDSAGNHLWNSTFGGSNYDVAYSVVQTSDGGYALAGYTRSFGAGYADFWLVRTDSAGNHLWNMTFGGSNYDYARSVVQTSDGFAVAGSTDSFGAGNSDFWLVRAFGVANYWNITKTLVTNIVNGEYLGGNYWHDYAGTDEDGDGLGDTPYSKGMLTGADNHPLVRVRNLNTSRGYATIQAAIDDAENGHTISAYGGLYIENVDVYRELTILGAGASITTVKAANPALHVFNVTAHNVNITGFTIKGATQLHFGIYVEDVQNCTIYNNRLIDNYIGIQLHNSHNSTISYNNITNNPKYILFKGIDLDNSSQNTIKNNTITGADTGVFIIDSYLNTVTNITVTAETFGIAIRDSDTNTVTFSDFSQSVYGILLANSTSNEVTCNVSDIFFGIKLVGALSTNNTISFNNVSSYTLQGISISSSTQNQINNNTLNGGSIGLFFENTESYYNKLENNTVNGETYYHHVNATGITIEGLVLRGKDVSNLGKISLVNCTNITIDDLTLANGTAGLFLYKTNMTNIGVNQPIRIERNSYGVLMASCQNNTVANSSMKNNTYGIYLDKTKSTVVRNSSIDDNYIGIYLHLSNNNTLIDSSGDSNYNFLQLQQSNENVIDNNSATNCFNAFFLNASAFNTFNQNNSTENTVGIRLKASNSNEFQNTIINSALQYDYHSSSDSFNNPVQTLLDGTEVSFYGRDFSLKHLLTGPPDPLPILEDSEVALHNIGRYFDVSNTSASGWTYLNIKYAPADLDGVRPQSLAMYKHNGTSWSLVPGINDVNVAEEYVYANVTSFSILAPLGFTVPALVVNKTLTPYIKGEGFFSTINAAFAAASTGYTIIVCPGTYTENVVVDKSSVRIVSYLGASSTVVTSDSNHVFKILGNNVTVSGFTIEGVTGYAGTYVEGDLAQISKNIFNDAGIILNGGSNADVIQNLVNLTGERGIYLKDSSNNSVAENVLDSRGIYLGNCTYSWITGNTVNWTGTAGIELYQSDHNRILSNSLERIVGLRSGSGIKLTGSDDNVISNNYGFIENNTRYGIYLLSSSFNQLVENNIVWTDRGVYLDQSSNNDVFNNTLNSNRFGVYLESSHDNDLIGNDAQLNDIHGIYLFSSDDNVVEGNNIQSNGVHGIYLDYSDDNFVDGNNIQYNGLNGIRLWTSCRNRISNNTASHHFRENGVGIFLDHRSNYNTITGNEASENLYGITVFISNHTVITSNEANLNVEVGIFIEGQLESEPGEIYASCHNTVSGNSVLNNTQVGIALVSTTDSEIYRNTVRFSDRGILMENHTDNCLVHENTFQNNSGSNLYIKNSSNNRIYHNNFLSAPPPAQPPKYSATDFGFSNTWDNGYPSGGNYWSDYSTTYPDAQELDDSGIWDTPYEGIEHFPLFHVEDRYPLMEPYAAGYSFSLWAQRLDLDNWLLEVQLQDTMGNAIQAPGVIVTYVETTDTRLLGQLDPVVAETNVLGQSRSVFTFTETDEIEVWARVTVAVFVRIDLRVERELPSFIQIPIIRDIVQMFVQYFLKDFPGTNRLSIKVDWKDTLRPRALNITWFTDQGLQHKSNSSIITWPEGFLHVSENLEDFELSELPYGNSLVTVTAIAKEGYSSSRSAYFFYVINGTDVFDPSWDWDVHQVSPDDLERMQGYIEYSYWEYGISEGEARRRAQEEDDWFMNMIFTVLDNYVPNFDVPLWVPFLGGHWGIRGLEIDTGREFNSLSGTGKSNTIVYFSGFDLGYLWGFPYQGPWYTQFAMDCARKVLGEEDFEALKKFFFDDPELIFALGAEGLYTPHAGELEKDQVTYWLEGKATNLPPLRPGIPILEIVEFNPHLEEVTVRLGIIFERDPTTDEFGLDGGFVDIDAKVEVVSIHIDVVIAEVGVSVGVVAGLGLGLRAGDFSWLDLINRAEIGVYATLDWRFLWFTEHLGMKWVYDIFNNEVYTAPASKPEGWRIMDRGYINEDYSKFVANLGIGHSSPTAEQMLIQNVFPQADPSLAADKKDNLMVVYVHDDPSKSPGQSFEIYYTMWDGYQWSTPRPITDNYVTDVKPAVTYDSSGNAIAAWTTINNEILSEDFSEIIRYGEIAYSIFNASTKTWSTPQLLTENTVFDYAPTLATDQDGDVMAMWQVDQDNNITIGSATNTTYSMERDYYYSVWNGSSWSAPALAIDDIDITNPLSFDFGNDKAVAAWSQDTDGNSTTKEDVEIFYSRWDGTTWSTPVRFTTDSRIDKLPSIVYTKDGKPLLTWIKDESIISPEENRTINNIYYTTYNGDWSTPALLSETTDVKALMLVKDPQDNPVLLWQQLSDEGTDIFYSVYDTIHNSWSLKNQLTSDDSAETTFTPVITSQNNIVSTYLKGLVTYQDQIFTYPNGTVAFISPVPNITSYDMYLLQHPIFRDLQITSQDITMSKTNPAPDETVKINATVHNVGDLTIDGVKVKFHDGLGGPQIGFTHTIDTINAGESKVVSTDWTVPTTPATHDIYVLVDPINEILEENETNNDAFITTVLPDLTVDRTLVSYASDSASKEMIINATIVNKGHVTASNIPVDFYYSNFTSFGEPKTLITSETIDALNPYSSQAVGTAWDVSTLEPGNYYVFVVVDEGNTILEDREINNIQRTLVRATPDLSINDENIHLSGDLEGNITVNMTVFNEGNFDAENVSVQAFGSSPYYRAYGNMKWNQTYGGAEYDEAFSMIQTRDGGYALAGRTHSSGAGGSDFWLVKTDSTGNHLWNQTYGGTSIDLAYSLVQTVDGGYALAGFTASRGAGYTDFWLVKTDSSGNMLWNQTYGGAGDDQAHSLVQTVDGGYALAGFTNSYSAGGWDFWLVKTDSSGNMLWNQTYGGAAHDGAISLAQTSDGGYALAGYTGSLGAGGSDFWLVKTDSSGNMLWNQTYGGASDDYGSSVVQLGDGSYAIAGWAHSFGAGGADLWLVKTDGSGNMLWNQTYGGASDDVANSLVQTSDGGYALAGGTSSFGAGGADFWLVRTDSAGTVLWNKTYGGASDDVANSLVQTQNGAYVMAGYTASRGAGSADFWLIETRESSWELNTTLMLFNETISVLPSKSNMTISKIWSAAPGDYNLHVLVDPNDRIQETNELNNLAVKPIRILQKLSLASLDAIDTDEDSLFDHVSAKVEADIQSDGYYCLTGNLTDNTGTQITTASNLTYLTSGTQNVTLNFNGIHIRQHGADGPYTLKDVKLYDSTSLLGLLLGAHPTPSYLYTEFQTSPATLADVVSDQGIDLDENGLYDYLEVDANVSVAKSGDYHVRAILHDANGNYTASAHNSTYLNTGIQSVKLRFSGPPVFSHGVNGPYNLSYITLYNENWNEIDNREDAYVTAAYAYTQFEGGRFDVATIDVTPSQTVVGQGSTISINVTVTNQGDYTETFNVTSYYDFDPIETQTVANLPSGTSTNLTFLWNTTGVAYGNYTISAHANLGPSETATADNTYIGDEILVTIPGDVDGDRDVDYDDFIVLAGAYGASKGEPAFRPEADIDIDNDVDYDDFILLAGNYGRSWRPFTVIGPWSGVEMDAFMPVLRAFEEETRIDVEYEFSTHGNLEGVLPSMFEAGTTPGDVIFMWSWFIKEKSQEGHILNVTDLISEADFMAGALDPVKMGDTLYGGTYTGKVKPGFWYRKSFFETHGLTPPTTWAEFTTLLDDIAALPGIINPIASGDGVGWPLSDVTEHFLATFGSPQLHRDLIAGTTAWNSSTVETIFVDRLVPLLQGNFSDPIEWTTALDNWWNGDYGLYFMGSWITGMVEYPEDLGVFSLPGAEGLVFAADFFFIPTYTEYPDEAKELFKFLASEEAQSIQVAQGGHISTNVHVPEHAYPHSDRQVSELMTGKEILTDLDDTIGGEFQTTFWDQLKLLWVDSTRLDEVLDALEAAAP